MHQLKGDPIFPLKMKPWTNGTGDDFRLPGKPSKKSPSFGSLRKLLPDQIPDRRLHAACDLHVPDQTQVYAVADGFIHSRGYLCDKFLGSTWAIQVNHDGFIVIYGEVIPDPDLLSKAEGISKTHRPVEVKQGDVIAKVAYQGCKGRESQLHFELYLNPSNADFIILRSGDKNYQRAITPENPTEYLVQWEAKISSTAPTPPPCPHKEKH